MVRVFEADTMAGIVSQGGDMEVTYAGLSHVEGWLSSIGCQMVCSTQ